MLEAWQPKYSMISFSHVYAMGDDHSSLLNTLQATVRCLYLHGWFLEEWGGDRWAHVLIQLELWGQCILQATLPCSSFQTQTHQDKNSCHWQKSGLKIQSNSITTALVAYFFHTVVLAKWVIPPASEFTEVVWAVHPTEHVGIFNGVWALICLQGSHRQVI